MSLFEYPLTLTIAQVQSELGISRGTVHFLLKRGDIKSVKIGTRRLVSAQSLREFVERGGCEVAQSAVAR